MGRNLRSFLGRARHGCAALLAAALVVPAVVHAQALPRADGVTSSYGSGRTRINAPSANGYWIPTADGTNVRLSTSGPVAAPGGRSANASVYTSMQASGAGGFRRLVARGLKFLPLIGTGILLWEFWNDLGARPDGNGGMLYDAGVSTVTQGVTCWGSANYGYTAGTCWTPAEACAYTAGLFNGSGCAFVQMAGDNQVWSWNDYRGYMTGQMTPRTQQQQACADGGDVRADGKCYGGAVSPATEADLELMAAQLTAADAVPLVDAALDAGATQPIPDAAPLVDPASLSPFTTDPSTTTGPNGTKTTSTTYDPSPGGPGVIEWEATTTTTTTDPQGNTTTETTTETPPPSDPCELFPNRIGCMDAGEPTAVELDTENKTVTVAPDSGWGAGDASCPSALQLDFMGQPIAWEYTGMCQFAAGIRPVVIGMAWLVAALIVLGIKSGD